MTRPPDDFVQLRSDDWTVAINPQGAELSLLRDAAGRDLLWNGDGAIWSGRAPILFPIVGELNRGSYLWHGERFALPRHGLARRRRFEVVRVAGNEALFRLRADAETMKVYPFRFELDVSFHIVDTTLEVQAIVRNSGGEPMPASLGFHPAFRWPLADTATRDTSFIEFGQDEPGPIRRLDAHGLLTAVRYPTPVQGRRLALHDSLFIDDVMIFDHLRSEQLRYGADGFPCLKVSFDDATHLGLWTKPGAGFICIEPWRGVADPVGYTGDFASKPGVFIVPPSGYQSLRMQLELERD